MRQQKMHTDLQTRFPNLYSGQIKRLTDQPAEWQVSVNLKDCNFLIDHGFQGMAVLPGSSYIEMATNLFHQTTSLDKTNIQLSNINFQNIVLLKASEEVSFKLSFESDRDGYKFACKNLDSSIVYATLDVGSEQAQKNDSVSSTSSASSASSASRPHQIKIIHRPIWLRLIR